MSEPDADEVCEGCGGEGSISIASSCSKPMGDCCGGCTRPCPVCCAKPEREWEWDVEDEADRKRKLDREDPLEF